MTSPQRPRAAATPTASPEGVTAKRTDLVEQRLRQCADDPMWTNHAEVSKLLLRYAADSLADYRSRAEAAESSLAAQAQRRDEVVEECARVVETALPHDYWQKTGQERNNSEAEVFIAAAIRRLKFSATPEPK